MAITRTARGVAQSKASNTSLTRTGVTFSNDELAIVGLAYETDSPIVDVKWGSRPLKQVRKSPLDQGDSRVALYRVFVEAGDTRDMVATWESNMSARAMFISSYSGVRAFDVGQKAGFGAGTTAPNTGTAVVSTQAETLQIAAFASLGPADDAQGTAGDGHTLGQRVGTTGAGALSNITLQETYKILSATGDVRASLSVSTGRAWACTIAAFAPAIDRVVAETGGGRIYLNDGDFQVLNEELEDIINANWTALNAMLPEDAQTNLSDQQKMDMFVYSIVRFPAPLKV